MNKISLFSLVLICLSFVSCKSSDDDDNTSSNQYTDCNRWIVNTMRDHYLWKEEIPGNDNLDFNSSPESFFKSLLSMKDGKNSSAGHYYYSYIEKNKNYKATTKGINDDSDSYGIDFVRYSIPILNTTKYEDYEYDRVMYVLSDSPAEKSGLKRGDWITRIDGKEINIANADYKKLLNGAARELTVYHVFPGLSTTIILRLSIRAINVSAIWFTTNFRLALMKITTIIHTIMN
jgi:carboxyl-terminal processing protease